MVNECIRVKSLALFTGSPCLIGFINYLKVMNHSQEVFRFIRRLIEQILSNQPLESENNLNICITNHDRFYEVRNFKRKV